MYQNGNWFTSKWAKWLLGIVAALLVGGGIAGPMTAIDNTNDEQQATLNTLVTWQRGFYVGEDSEWQVHLQEYSDFYDAFTELNTAFIAFYNTDPAKLGEWQKYVDKTDKAIQDLNDWLKEFYNDDPEALGEWQEAMAIWDDFYDAAYNPLTGYPKGEFQEAIAKVYAYIATALSSLSAQIAALTP